MSAVDRDKLIAKIQALWAKADRSDFEAEAELFAAKAQQMMTAYLIEEHEIAGVDANLVVIRKFAIHGKYSSARRSLLSAVCRTNGVYLVIDKIARKKAGGGAEHVEMYGTAAAIDLALGLYSKLDLECLGHVSTVGQGRRDVRSFRFGFVTGFAATIAARLTKTVAETPGAGLVLADRRSEGQKAAHTQAKAEGVKLSSRTRYVSSAGYASGEQAGHSADLGGARFSGRAALPAAR